MALYNVKVETYSGYKADEYPVKFWIDEEPSEIIDIEDRWYSPDYSYFKVFADNGKRYILQQNLKTNQWQIKRLEVCT